MIGTETLYPIPNLTSGASSFFPYALNYPSASINATWDLGEISPSLYIYPTIG
jgi:hypothetical protein